VREQTLDEIDCKLNKPIETNRLTQRANAYPSPRGKLNTDPIVSDFVLVDSVAIQVMSVLPEKPSVLVIISWVLFQMDGEVVAYVSSSGKLYTTLIDTPGGIVTEHSQPDGQFERSGLDSEQICKPSKQNGHKQ